MGIEFGVGAAVFGVFVVSEIRVPLGGGDFAAKRVDGIGHEHLLADHDAEKVVGQLEVELGAKAAFFEAFIEVGMVAKLHNQVVKARRKVGLDVVAEFVG